MSKKVLVTGASGFLGGRLVRALIDGGATVKAMVRASSSLRGLQGLPADRLEVVEGDVRVEHAVFRALAGCDRMYHVAAVNRLWSRDPAEILAPAIEGTEVTLEAACKRGIRRVVYTSSVATLGVTAAPEAMDEGHAFNLQDAVTYVEAKRRAEEVALSFSDRLEIIAAQPSVMLGPGDTKPTPGGQALLQFLTWSAPLMDFPVIDGGLNYVDVDDVAQGHVLLMEKGAPGERYILGGDNLTYEQFFSMASELTGVNGPGGVVSKGALQLVASLQELRARLGGPEPMISSKAARDFAGAYAWVSSAKAEALGYTHRPARRALARGIQWFLEQGYLRDTDARRLRLHLRAPS
ncbi:MAG: NAD-dependent epimerase/dehydratase family protein [Polyangiaceae bacterium]|jgi:dihydroflavonol-4-reductase|nr:NAD-dependent epimerase/dehydratase family protein [Polyangiaceae bacterium]